jgi:K+-transporting ATPase c subunit
MSLICSEKTQTFKNIIGKLPEDIFKEVCSYALPREKDYIFQYYEDSNVVKILNYSKTNDNIDYAINKLKSKLQKEAIILDTLIKNDLPVAEKDYDIKLKNALKQIIKNIVSKSKYVSDKKINEIISVYVRNINILDVEKTNNKKFKIILTLNKIRNYKLFKHLIVWD